MAAYLMDLTGLYRDMYSMVLVQDGVDSRLQGVLLQTPTQTHANLQQLRQRTILARWTLRLATNCLQVRRKFWL